jgi:peptide deformylase
MSILPVVKMGNAELATPSLIVTDFATERLRALIQDMRDTMEEEGGVGIAAPQIGYNSRIILFGFEKSERYPGEKPIPFTILINPGIKPLTEEMVDGWEGCLSVPGLRGLVPRYTKISYEGFDMEGNSIQRVAENFHARVLQHECDHLDGILYPQRIKDMRYFGFEDELKRSTII